MIMETCKDCISFNDCLKEEQTRFYGIDMACNNVEKLCKFFKKKDVVEVVRCKDCKHYSDGDCFEFPVYGDECSRAMPEPDDFCSYGKRKEVEE